MSYGLQVQSSYGGIQFSLKAFGAAVIDMRTLACWTSGTVQYPDFAGRSIFVFMEPRLANAGSWANPSYQVFSVSTPGGIPTLTWNFDAAKSKPKLPDIPVIVFVQ